jgi:hypothetical protein
MLMKILIFFNPTFSGAETEGSRFWRSQTEDRDPDQPGRPQDQGRKNWGQSLGQI